MGPQVLHVRKQVCTNRNTLDRNIQPALNLVYLFILIRFGDTLVKKERVNVKKGSRGLIPHLNKINGFSMKIIHLIQICT